MTMHAAYCPECEYRLKLGTRPYKGQKVICSSCDKNLIVTTLKPLILEAVALPQSSERKKNNTIDLACPECEAMVRISSRVREGQQVVCTDCETLLEVISIDPIELDEAMMIDIKNARRQKGRR